LCCPEQTPEHRRVLTENGIVLDTLSVDFEQYYTRLSVDYVQPNIKPVDREQYKIESQLTEHSDIILDP